MRTAPACEHKMSCLRQRRARATWRGSLPSWRAASALAATRGGRCARTCVLAPRGSAGLLGTVADQVGVRVRRHGGALSLDGGRALSGGAFSFHDEEGRDRLAPPGSPPHLLLGRREPALRRTRHCGRRYAIACWFTRDAAAVELPPPLSAAAPPPPLSLWSSDRAIASAAECCLASNDPLHEALDTAAARGRPLLAALHAEAPSLADRHPAAWRSSTALAAQGHQLNPNAADACTRGATGSRMHAWTHPASGRCMH